MADGVGLVAGLVPRVSGRREWQRIKSRSAVYETTQYGLSSHRISLRSLVDQLVFGYYELMAALVPRKLSEQFGKNLSAVEAYRCVLHPVSHLPVFIALFAAVVLC